MILTTIDPSGQQRFFAGFYRDNTICFSSHEHVAADKTLAELMTVAVRAELPNFIIRERIRVTPTLWKALFQSL